MLKRIMDFIFQRKNFQKQKAVYADKLVRIELQKKQSLF
jgi:hypothetical protein